MNKQLKPFSVHKSIKTNRLVNPKTGNECSYNVPNCSFA